MSSTWDGMLGLCQRVAVTTEDGRFAGTGEVLLCRSCDWVNDSRVYGDWWGTLEIRDLTPDQRDVFEPKEEQIFPDLVLVVVGGDGHGVPFRPQDPLTVEQSMTRVTGTSVRLLVREITEQR